MILGCLGIIFEDSQLEKLPKWEIQDITKSGPKTRQNEKNEVLETKFSQPTLKNY